MWNFAITRVKLAQLATDPVSGFDKQYQLPTDWIRTVQVFDNDGDLGRVEYRLEGSALLSNATDIYLRYVNRVTDPNAMTPDFREVLAWRLAMDLAISIANSGTLHDRMVVQYRSHLRHAKSTDAIEDFPLDVPDGSWLDGRN